jgi:hypothetical protein
MKRPTIQTSGDVMVVDLPFFRSTVFGASALAVSLFAALFAQQRLSGTGLLLLLAATPLGVLFGLYQLGLRRRMILNRAARTVRVQSRWLFLSRSRELTIEGRVFGVQRRRQRSDSGTTDLYDVVFGEHALTTFAEDEREAERLAEALGTHMGIHVEATRDSDATRRARERERKFAMYPLVFVLIAIAGVAVYLLVSGPG